MKCSEDQSLQFCLHAQVGFESSEYLAHESRNLRLSSMQTANRMIYKGGKTTKVARLVLDVVKDEKEEFSLDLLNM